MRNFIFVFVLFFSINSFSQARISQDNFEGNSTITSWFGDNCGMDNAFVNPFQNGINTSARVLKYTDAGGQYANVRFDAGFNYNLNTSSVFTLKIYVPSSGITGNQNNQVSLKLQNASIASPWATQCEIIKPVVLNQWQTITFNFATDNYINLDPNSQNPLDRRDFNRVLIQVNGENNTSQVTAYIDDFYYSGAASIFNTLVWSDEFEINGGINTTKWFPQTQLPNGNSWYNGELQHYTNRQVNSSVNNGILSIVAKRETFTDQGRTKQFTSARLNSKFAFKYGRVEVRAKLPIGAGTWPAIWMLGKNIIEPGGYWTSSFGTTSWPACGEIDIMEHWGTNQNFVQSAIHTTSSSGSTINLGGQTIPTASSQFHIYALEWTASKMIFSVDDIVHYIYNPSIKNASTWPFDAEQYLLLNVAIQSSITTSFVQSAMEVDYVRVYQQTALESPNVLKENNLVLFPNPAFDEITLKSNENLIGATITISSLLGQDLAEFKLNSQEKTLNISNYQSGIYILKVNSEQGIQSYKFIKK
ncbi:MAG: glycosyl hydrolase family protein [Flavobacteriaceae bacterium]|nr:glycosyl hydrolase family protein [Flavobacteriaceae bacterium]